MTTNPISATKIAGSAEVSSIPTQTTGNSLIPAPRPDEISIYIHIPFCAKKCDYCHFFVLPNKADLKDLLMQGLDLELKYRTPLLASKTFVSLYFGGGTPALLGPEKIGSLIEQVCSLLGNTSPESLEITLEANPDDVTESLMKAYKDVGVNRVSIGVQSLDDLLLRRLGRIHHSAAAVEAVYRTVDAGISNISIDLMYDIPGQTLQSWHHTLNQVVKLPITHLSLYNLTIEPHTAFFKYREKLSKELPDAESSTSMYQDAVKLFEISGLQRYEISAFARPGLYSRHNTGYWLGRPFLGFGPSAFSYWDQSRFRNVSNLNRYLEALRAGETPVDFEETLQVESQIKELLSIELRLRQGVNFTSFETRHGKLPLETKKSIAKLLDEGFLESQQDGIRLSEKGILFYDSVAVELI